MRFQTIAPVSPPRITFGSTMAVSIMPLPIVRATAVPPTKAAMKLKNAAHATACRGVSTRVATTVAMEFAESWKPLMKSKMNATRTIARTYQITSGVLEGDALQRMHHRHAAVDRVLEAIVDLLPFDDVQRVRIALEQVAHGLMVDGVPFLLDALHLDRAGIHFLRPLDAFDAALQVLRGFREQLAELTRRRSDVREVKGLGAPCRAIQKIDDVVEACRQRVDVLAVDRRDEALVDAGVDLMRELIRLVLDLLDRPNLLLQSCGVVKQLAQQARRVHQMCCELVEQREELLVPRNEASEHLALG